MGIFLVQHGKAVDKQEDAAQPLADEGRGQVKRVAAVAAGAGIRPDRILHSGKLRARQTAEILAEALQPPQSLSARAGLNPTDEVEAFAPYIIESDEELMVVGHLPFLDRLAALLLTGDPEQGILRFHHGGIVYLAREDETWRLWWTILPAHCPAPEENSGGY